MSLLFIVSCSSSVLENVQLLVVQRSSVLSSDGCRVVGSWIDVVGCASACHSPSILFRVVAAESTSAFRSYWARYARVMLGGYSWEACSCGNSLLLLYALFHCENISYLRSSFVILWQLEIVRSDAFWDRRGVVWYRSFNRLVNEG